MTDKEIKNISNLQDIEIGEKIIGWKCQECDQEITKEHYNDKNFTLLFSVGDSDSFEGDNDLKGTKYEGLYKARLTLNIIGITHEKTSFYDCPDTEICSGCNKKFLAEKTKSGLYEDASQDEKTYGCEPCFNEKYGEYLKERSKKKPMTQEQKEVMKIVKKAMTEHLNSNYHHGGNDYSNCKGSECEGYKLTLESYGYDREK